MNDPGWRRSAVVMAPRVLMSTATEGNGSLLGFRLESRRVTQPPVTLQ